MFMLSKSNKQKVKHSTMTGIGKESKKKIQCYFKIHYFRSNYSKNIIEDRNQRDETRLKECAP